MTIDKYFSILIEWNLESLGGERFLLFEKDRERLFQNFESQLKALVQIFVENHSDVFAYAECGDLCEIYPELGLNSRSLNFDDPVKILGHIFDRGKNNFISTENSETLFLELDDLLDWISNVPSYPNKDYIQISIYGNYPEFIEKWYRRETISPMLPLQHNRRIGDSSYNDEDAAIIGWLCILMNSEKWYEKPDAVKFVSHLADKFNKMHVFT
jgi:hypothetical protein